ncbi:DNase I-like protein [Artomyces pyxidatus]|uniref:DNase I-like protein n=1 Tax=Artomyces pyxidatus TaxID=48021 RepID=A0ACB8SJD6_9AGAM|nr:DNase I-like protein [Artomyces pyxidatus]
MVVDDSSVCFINVHLAAGQRHVRQRNSDIAAILEERSVFPQSEALDESLAYVGGGDGSMVLDHEIVFVSPLPPYSSTPSDNVCSQLNGDMNYRIDQRRDVVVSHVRSNDYHGLAQHDQLNKEMKLNAGFRLRAFVEGPLAFPPTYKYDRRSNEYDTSEKRRCPAWCDRVLWRARDPQRVAQLHYARYEVDVSDHRPISAGFRMTVKSVVHDARAAALREVQGAWAEHEKELLESVRAFYVAHLVI